ncbi:MAG TPA: hypothetical protein VE978_08595 [Chitinophagales bacterium]|nr:hypothetical protein [Chitinophagales bacterium]
MKKFLLPAVFALLIENSFAQQNQNSVSSDNASHQEKINSDHSRLKSSNLPQPVRDSWKKNYSAIKGAQWYKTADGYMVYYDYKNFQSRILYGADGNVRMHSREVDSGSVPVAILNFIRKKYPEVQYGKMYMSYPVQGENIYEIQIGDDWERFDANGNNIEDKTLLNKAER